MLYSINDPEFIAMVEKGVPIETLERRMRPNIPGQISDDAWNDYSKAGFLGPDESLLEVIYADDTFIRNLGLRHEDIANRLLYFVNSSEWGRTAVVDKKYKVKVVEASFGHQKCPWDDYDRGDEDEDSIEKLGGSKYQVENMELGESLSFPDLIIHLIRKHCFFEGKQSQYRVDPAQTVRVLEIK